MDQFVTNEITVQDAPGLEAMWRFDWRVMALLLKRWLLVFLALFAVLGLTIFLGLRRWSMLSMNRWQAEVKLFHQLRSERVPSFYKQIDTKVIAEIIGNSVHLRKAAERLQLPDTQIATLGELIEVELLRSRPSMITVRASHNEARMAAALANAVAEEGLNAYIELQNGTLQGMLMERRQRRIRLQETLYELEKSLTNFSVPGSLLRPDREMARLDEAIVALLMQVAVDETEVLRLGVLCEETSKTMATLDKEVTMLSRVYGGRDSELSHLRGRLVTMMQQYTENNPQIRVLQDEIDGRQRLLEEAAKEERGLDEVVYTTNTVYTTLEQRLLQAQIDRIALQKRIEVQNARLEELRRVMKQQQELSAGYQETQRKIASTTQNITQLDATINDMELLLNSAVPDLSILDSASVPRLPSSNTLKAMLLSLLGAAFVVCALLLLLLLHELVFGRVKSPRDFRYLSDMDELGILPVPGEAGNYVLDAALHKIFIQLRAQVGDGRRILLCQMSPNSMAKPLRESWNMNFGINGLRVFWLKCLSLAAREQQSDTSGQTPQRLPEEGLVAIEKYGNRGFFHCENPLVLTPAEWELLNADLNELEKDYGVIVIEREMPSATANILSEQFCRMVDYTVVLAAFGVEKKMALRHLLYDERLGGMPVGGILTDVKKSYWRVFTGEGRS
jgi:uncharacterized protein involved in exopolysaccharide biosynthesis